MTDSRNSRISSENKFHIIHATPSELFGVCLSLSRVNETHQHIKEASKGTETADPNERQSDP